MGNGHRIRIWEDPWLPIDGMFKVQSPRGNWEADERAEVLIHEDTKEWDLSAIQQRFEPEEISKIVSIPVSKTDQEDVLVWHYDRQGEYTVRSAYKRLMEVEEITMNAGSNGSEQVQWQKIWNTRAPTKMKIHLWRMVRGILPTKRVLFNRHIINDDKCIRCGQQPESIDHAIRTCQEAAAVWKELCFDWCQGTSWEEEDRDWIGKMVNSLNKEGLQQLTFIAWNNWKARNYEFYEGRKREARCEAAYIKNYIAEFNAAWENNLGASITPVQRWQPLERGFIKANFDASFKANTKEGGVGVIFRDEHRNVMGAYMAKMNGWANAGTLEAIAASKAVEVAIDLGFRCLVLEGDALVVIKKLYDTGPDLSDIGIVLADIRARCRTFLSVNFSYVSREGNKVAHCLAQHGMNGVTDETFWIEDYPHFVQQAISADAI